MIQKTSIINILCIFILVLYPKIAYTKILNVPGEHATIQEGMFTATDGDTVLVEKGEYYELIDFMGKGVLLASTYIFDFDSTSIYQTIINGDSTETNGGGSVVTFSSGEDTSSILCGFTIMNGIGTYIEDQYYTGFIGGGVYGTYSSPSLSHNIIKDNTANAIPIEGDLGKGGGIYFRGGSPKIEDNLVMNNTAYALGQHLIIGTGGGRYLEECSSTLVSRNRIINNEAGGNGAGIGTRESWVTIFANDIDYNEISAGIHCQGEFVSQVFISNNKIIGNEVYGIIISEDCFSEIKTNLIALNNMGGVDIRGDNSFHSIINNTIVANGIEDTIYGQAGLSILTNIGAEVKNNIIVFNNGYGLRTPSIDHLCEIDYNNVWANVEGQYFNFDPGENDISLNPHFTDAFNGDFSLSALSPCIDAGNPESTVPEHGGDRIDIGAFEYYQPFNGFLTFGGFSTRSPNRVCYHLGCIVNESCYRSSDS